MRPWVRKRSRHLPTVWRLTPTLSATVALSRPSVHRRTSSARRTRPAGRLRDRAIDASSSRVSGLTSSGFKGRPGPWSLLLRAGGWREPYLVCAIMSRYFRDGTLAVGRLAQPTTILPGHAHRMCLLFGHVGRVHQKDARARAPFGHHHLPVASGTAGRTRHCPLQSTVGGAPGSGRRPAGTGPPAQPTCDTLWTAAPRRRRLRRFAP